MITDALKNYAAYFFAFNAGKGKNAVCLQRKTVVVIVKKFSITD